MAGNAQKTPFAQAINRFAEKKVYEAIQLLGKALPCQVTAVSGSIVTVKFLVNSPIELPQVTVPMVGIEYARPPIQVGCMGIVFPSDVGIGGISGLGGGAPDIFSVQANLSSLTFFPVSNKNWSATDNQNAYVIYGPDGVILRDLNSQTKFTLTPDGVTIDLQPGKSLTVNGQLVVTGLSTLQGNLQLGGALESVVGGTYAGDVKTAGNVIAGFGTGDQVGALTHTHISGGSGSPTSAPTAGT